MQTAARIDHQMAHPLNTRVQAAEDCLANEEMADVELDDFRHPGNRCDRVIR